jgi:hypothetical protein
LRDDGSITFGKIILETLGKKFGPKFRWIISQEGDSIEVKYGIIRIRTSQRMLDRMFAENLDRSREIKKEIVERRFFAAFLSEFTMPPPSAYVPGSISKLLSAGVVKKLSCEDKRSPNPGTA